MLSGCSFSEGSYRCSSYVTGYLTSEAETSEVEMLSYFIYVGVRML